jgi:hypothetical protein
MVINTSVANKRHQAWRESGWDRLDVIGTIVVRHRGAPHRQRPALTGRPRILVLHEST